MSGEPHVCLRLQKPAQGLERLQACLSRYRAGGPQAPAENASPHKRKDC